MAKTRWLRWMPRLSLAGRLTVLLIGALLFGHAITFWIAAQEREEAVRTTARQLVVARVASVHRLIEETPDARQNQLIRAVSSPLFGYSIDDSPAIRRMNESRLERRIARALIRELALPPDSDVRVEVVQSPTRGRIFDDDDDDDDDDHDEHHRRHPPPASLRLSIPIMGGAAPDQWLNVRIGDTDGPPPYAWISLLSLAIVGAAIVLIVLISTRQITRPLLELATAAEQFGRGGKASRVRPRGAPEIRQTIDAFNAMQERIARFVADRTRMLAAMSHDLRTPITSLRLQAEFVEDDELKAKIVSILEDMQAMAEASLAFAREDAQSEETRLTDVTALLESIAADAGERGLDVTGLDNLPKIRASIRPQAIKRALTNLVDNACRYGERARIGLDDSADDVVITIDDDGPGIAADRLDSVFEPFVRLEESRSRLTGGAGLGLAIVRTIIQSHGGAVRLENRVEGGLRAIVTLPSVGRSGGSADPTRGA